VQLLALGALHPSGVLLGARLLHCGVAVIEGGDSLSTARRLASAILRTTDARISGVSLIGGCHNFEDIFAETFAPFLPTSWPCGSRGVGLLNANKFTCKLLGTRTQYGGLP